MLQSLDILVETFESVAGVALRAHPIQNQLLLGVLERALDDPGRYPEGVRLFAVLDGSSGDIGVALQIPPYKVLLSVATAEIATELGLRFAAHHPDVRQVQGPDVAAWAFANGAGASPGQLVAHEGLHVLHSMRSVALPDGRVRVAVPEDGAVLQSWLDAFVTEALPAGHPKDARAGVRLAASGRAWLWIAREGTPVALAVNPRRVGGWHAVGPVYTPPEYRGRGYATGLVASVTEAALAGGAKGCTLFTNLANATSNRIYERIGYNRIGTYDTVAW
jgi:predicted GNAT family acetyltransferase